MGSERPARRTRSRSQRRRRPRRRRWIVGLGLLGLLLVYLAITAAVAGTALRSARVEVAALRSAVAAGDDAALSAPLQQLQGDLGRARVALAGPVWWAAQQLPMIGDDVRAVRTVADVGDELASGPLADLTPDRVRGLTDGLVPENGRVDLPAVARLAPLASELSDSADDAASRLAQVEPEGLVGPLGTAYAEASAQVGRLAGGLEAARRATEVLPEVLGQDGPRTYLVMANNNAEVRATGGIAGPMVLLRADGGRLTEAGSTSTREIGVFEQPVLPQSKAERAIYDTQVATYPQDVNFTPDFPRTAELLRAMLAQRPGVKVDGVVGVDAVTLSYLLRSTGPLDVPGGPQLTADNATDELINQVYFRIPQPLRQDAYFGRVAQRVVDATLGGRPDAAALLSALRQSASEGRLHLHLFDADAQEAIAGTSLAGDVFDRSAPQVGLYLNDATGSKLSYYLRRSASLSSTSCTRAGHTLRGRAQLSYTADSPPVKDLPEYVTGGGAFGIPAGQQLLLARLYGPDGGTMGDVRLDGEELTEPAVDDRGRDVVTAAILLSRGQEVELTWEVTVPDADAQVELSLSPGMEAAPALATTTGCG